MNPQISQIRTNASSVAKVISARREMADSGPTTSPTLLGRMQCWEDTAAWKLFVDRYHDLFETWSNRRLRNPADVDEVNQQVYWEVARRLPAFQYDSNRSFRGWLRTLHQSRLLDFLKMEKRRLRREADVVQGRVAMLASAQKAQESVGWEPEASVSPVADRVPSPAAFEIQQCVRCRVSEQSWAVFLEIAVNGQSVAETAQRYSMKYASTYAAYSRVARMLKQEAECRNTEAGDSDA